MTAQVSKAGYGFDIQRTKAEALKCLRASPKHFLDSVRVHVPAPPGS